MSPYKNGLKKICKSIFSFTNINTLFITQKSQVELEFIFNKFPNLLDSYLGNINNLLNIHKPESKDNVFIHSTSFRLNYISAKIYDDKEYIGSILIGPYIIEEPTSLMIENVIFENKIPLSLKHIVEQYYLALPLISTYKVKVIAEFVAYNLLNLNTISSHDINISNINYEFKAEYSTSSNISNQNTDLSMRLIEQRYAAENEFMYAVEHGNKEMLEKFMNEDFFSLKKMPDRIPNDPLRSLKNISFVINTLLRKASEKGGLHPSYIHSISEKFAIQIEKSSSIRELIDLHDKMMFEYCDSVKKFSLKNYNYITRKAIEFIRLNLEKNLSLEGISSAIDANSYELSRQFNKETGQTITEYINKQRINEAIPILDNQNISITSIAHMVGFNDVNYFTKVFKQLKGITPSQYRKSTT